MPSRDSLVLREQLFVIPIVCAWCQKMLGTKPSETPGTTHSICPGCRAAHFPRVKAS